MKILFFILGGLIFLFVAVLIKYLRIIMTIFLNIPIKAESKYWTLSRGEEVRFLSLRHHPLKGILFKTAEFCKTTIIFCHEFGGNSSFCAPYISFLLKNGYNVFSFDFRGHGESLCQDGYTPTPWATMYEIDDILGAVRYIVKEREDLGGNIGILGISRGAVSAITSIPFAPEIKAIVSDSAFSTLQTMIFYMQKWVSIFAILPFIYKRFKYRFYSILGKMAMKMAEIKYRICFPSLEKTLERNSVPIFFTHGKQDSYIDCKHAQYLYEKSIGPKELWIVEGARHNEGLKVAPEEYAQKVVNFFKKYLPC